MARRGDGFGSEDHFLRYRSNEPAELDRVLLAALGTSSARLDWVYPRGLPTEREPIGISFLGNSEITSLWTDYWPQRGRSQTWDGIAKLSNAGLTEWVLIEVKANAPEFVSPPCAASSTGGRASIEKTLNRLKQELGVHRFHSWLGTYYQYANRLAVLSFLTKKAKVPARLLHIYITGDVFPDGTPCPASESDWLTLIEARRLTLGLPKLHALSDRCHQAFLPALPKKRVR